MTINYPVAGDNPSADISPDHDSCSVPARRSARHSSVCGAVGITGAGVDITELKRVQEELGKAVEFRDRMMGILGHELRNPLSSIKALGDLLQRQQGVSDKVREALGRIARSADRMNAIIGSVLDFTQVRFHGGLPLSTDPAELEDIARLVVDELRVAHPTRVIDVAAHGELRGRWDGGRIGQVVSNLVGNALAHGAPDTPVQVALSQEDGSVVLSVTNRGPTIPEALAERLFEPFVQAPGDSDHEKRRHSGLGLGLYIVRQIVLAHGGTTAVRSCDGITTFTVRLPHVATT